MKSKHALGTLALQQPPYLLPLWAFRVVSLCHADASHQCNMLPHAKNRFPSSVCTVGPISVNVLLPHIPTWLCISSNANLTVADSWQHGHKNGNSVSVMATRQPDSSLQALSGLWGSLSGKLQLLCLQGRKQSSGCFCSLRQRNSRSHEADTAPNGPSRWRMMSSGEEDLV